MPAYIITRIRGEITGHFSWYFQHLGGKHHEKGEASTLIEDMANGVVKEETANGDPEEKARLKRANTVELYDDILTASHPILPSNARVTYMNEGAANIVYNLSVDSFDKEPEKYKETVPNSQSERARLSIWDGRTTFCSSIHVIILSIQALNNFNIFLVIFPSSAHSYPYISPQQLLSEITC